MSGADMYAVGGIAVAVLRGVYRRGRTVVGGDICKR